MGAQAASGSVCVVEVGNASSGLCSDVVIGASSGFCSSRVWALSLCNLILCLRLCSGLSYPVVYYKNNRFHDHLRID